jgi:uncharacterized protein with PQ loop repeat
MDPNHPVPFTLICIGAVVSVLLYMSPIPVVRTIIRERSVSVFRPDTFIVGVSYGIPAVTYPILAGLTVPIISASAGLCLYSGYLCVYYHFSTDRPRTRIRFLRFFLPAVALIASGPAALSLTDHFSPNWSLDRGGLMGLVRVWFGVCVAVGYVLLLAGQLTSVSQVMKDQDSRAISGWMVAAGVLRSVCWLTYGALILDLYYLTANAGGLVIVLFQAVVKCKYRRTSVAPIEGSLKTVSDDTV